MQRTTRNATSGAARTACSSTLGKLSSQESASLRGDSTMAYGVSANDHTSTHGTTKLESQEFIDLWPGSFEKSQSKKPKPGRPRG